METIARNIVCIKYIKLFITKTVRYIWKSCHIHGQIADQSQIMVRGLNYHRRKYFQKALISTVVLVR